MQDNVLKRLTFLKKKMQRVQKEVIEMGSLVVKLDEEYYKNCKEIERIEKELAILESSSISSVDELSSNVSTEGTILIDTGMLSQFDIVVKDLKTKDTKGKITIEDPAVDKDAFRDLLKKFLIEQKELALSKLNFRNERLVAELEDLTKDYEE